MSQSFNRKERKVEFNHVFSSRSTCPSGMCKRHCSSVASQLDGKFGAPPYPRFYQPFLLIFPTRDVGITVRPTRARKTRKPHSIQQCAHLYSSFKFLIIATQDTRSLLDLSIESSGASKISQVGITVARSDDGSAGSAEFGIVVAIASEGQRLAVGAPGFNGVGGVFVYELVNGGIWYLIWSLVTQGVGSRLSLSGNGNQIAVRGLDSVVNVYNVDSGETLGGPVTTGVIGSTVSLSLDGAFLAVSDETFQFNSGRVTIFQLVGDNWAPLYSFVSDGETSRFGWVTSFSSDGSSIAISAPNFNQGGLDKRGLVRVYTRIGSIYTQTGSDLLGSQSFEQFGFSMALSDNGDYLIVGSPRSNGNGNLRGKACIYHKINNEWKQVGNDINGDNDKDYLSRSVEISSSGLRVAITSFYHNAQRGQLRVFDLVGGTWTLLSEVQGEASGDRLGFGNFGLSMTSDGSRLAVGSLAGVDSSEGLVQVFDVNSFEEIVNQVSDSPSQLSKAPEQSTTVLPSATPTTFLSVISAPSLPTREISKAPLDQILPTSTSTPTQSQSLSPGAKDTPTPTRQPSKVRTSNAPMAPLAPAFSSTPTLLQTLAPAAKNSTLPTRKPSKATNTTSTRLPTVPPTVPPTQLPSVHPSSSPSALPSTGESSVPSTSPTSITAHTPEPSTVFSTLPSYGIRFDEPTLSGKTMQPSWEPVTRGVDNGSGLKKSGATTASTIGWIVLFAGVSALHF